jgi:murein DD-endopeptidase MepM/ murein hydrolase activator NlpD
MKKSLREELERIHTITYGKRVVTEENIIDKIFKTIGIDRDKLPKIDEPKKADFASSDVEEFFTTLNDIDYPIFQQNYGSMTYQKDVETVQIGLIILGYELPRFGVDGKFGPETARAVVKFKLDNQVNDNLDSVNEAYLISPVPSQGVTSGFGEKRSYENHPGVDLKVNSGTPIKSPADGTILDAETRSNSCGGTIQIQHADGFVSRYCHCKNINVSKGQSVKQGEVVGLTGGAKGDSGRGNSTGAHLHFELKKDGKLVNPMNFIGKEVGDYDFSKSSGGESGEVISPAMVKVLIDKLQSKGITSEDLQKYVDTIKIGNLNDKNFYMKLLENLGAPISDENMKFLYAWRQAEGKAGKFNPFNTTWDLPNSTNFNKVGVKNYVSLEDGMVATVKTLKNGLYECILKGLRDDIGADNIAKCESLKTWGTGDLVGKVVSSYNSGSNPKVSGLA